MIIIKKPDLHSSERRTVKLIRKVLNHHSGSVNPQNLKNRIQTYNQFKESFPITQYKDYKESIQHSYETGESILSKEPISFFASTSGMTGDPKLIPHTRSSIRYYLQESLPLFLGILTRVRSKLLSGKYAFIVGRIEDRKSPGNVPVGSISGKIASVLYNFAPLAFSHSIKEIDHLDTSERYARILEGINKSSIAGVLGTNPLLIKRVLDDAANISLNSRNDVESYREIYHKLAFIMCITGWPASEHLSTLRSKLADDVNIFDVGVGASEGLFTKSLLLSEPLGTPIRGVGNFIEWMPIGGSELDATVNIHDYIGEEVEPLLTSANGFKRYRIGDRYRVESINNTIALRFLYKAQETYSATIEKVTPQTISGIVSHLDTKFTMQIKDYVCAIQLIPGGKGRYWLIISSDRPSYSRAKTEIIQNYLDILLIKSSPEMRNAREESRFLLKPNLVCDDKGNNVLNIMRSGVINSTAQEKAKIIFVGKEADSLISALN